MKPIRHAILTKDGSSTLRIEELKETYHSRHGAVVESEFVYINEGLRFWMEKNPSKPCRVLELGYGTGLMAYLSLLYAQKHTIEIEYTSLEAFPLKKQELESLNYNRLFQDNNAPTLFDEFNKIEWEKLVAVSPYFKLNKKEIKFEDFTPSFSYDLIFYDAFGFHAQPELWSQECMTKCYELSNHGGLWVSYCAKGSVRRGLEQAGFKTFRLPGPPGKREMLRAIKP